MIHLSTILFLLAPVVSALCQENLTPGKVTLVSGENLEGMIDDRFWTTAPGSFGFVKSTGERVVFSPQDVIEIRIGEKSIYKSRLVEYDSVGIRPDEITEDRNPRYKQKHIFLKVIVAASKSLLIYNIEKDHFFVDEGDHLYELVNHPYRARIGSNEARIDNRLFVGQLRALFHDCSTAEVPDNFPFTIRNLSELFLKYASCTGTAGTLYRKKDPSIVKIGLVGVLGYDEMRSDFKGGTGYGGGGYVATYFPYKIYKYSLYSELIYRRFGNQIWEGVDYANLPYRESHKIQSMKLTVMARSRLSKAPGPAYPGYTFIGIGVSGSFALPDLYQRVPYVATSAAPFVGLVFATGVYLNKHVACDLRYETGSQIYYNDFAPADNRLSKCTGYSSLQASLLIEF